MARILIVDDEDLIRMMLRQLLEQEGYEVEEAPNGRIALEIYRDKPIDLVIMDIIMPEKEGVETIMELKREFENPKIIAISGGGRSRPETYLKMAEQLGASRAFIKPIDHDALLKAIRSMLN